MSPVPLQNASLCVSLSFFPFTSHYNSQNGKCSESLLVSLPSLKTETCRGLLLLHDTNSLKVKSLKTASCTTKLICRNSVHFSLPVVCCLFFVLCFKGGHTFQSSADNSSLRCVDACYTTHSAVCRSCRTSARLQNPVVQQVAVKPPPSAAQPPRMGSLRAEANVKNHATSSRHQHEGWGRTQTQS